MKTYKFALRTLSLLSVLTLSFVACEQDFASIDSDIINPDTATNFETDNTPYSVITYTDALGPVQTDNLAINFLGVYDDPNYGETIGNIVTQLRPTTLSPDFGSGAMLESVVITIPYFSRTTGFDDNNRPSYKLDSIYPYSEDDTYSSIKLSIYESNYFLRDFDPNSSFGDVQNYFSNGALSENEMISVADLQFEPIDIIDELEISNDAIVLNSGEDNETIQPPAIRLEYTDPSSDAFQFWQTKILGLPQNANELSNSNNFNNYFRGIFFKAESVSSGQGSLIGLNLSSDNANITLTYSQDPEEEGDERPQNTYVLRFNGNRINLLNNNFTNPITDGDPNNGDSKLFLKGGQGAVAKIKLFNGDEQEFENFKTTYANYDNETDAFVSYRRLINEANLIFYVDEAIVRGEEPSRIFIYDTENNLPLADYFLDLTIANTPIFSKPNHLGILERTENDFSSNGIKYKFKITEHLKRLIENSSTNVTLGLAVSGNVNLEEIIPQRNVLGQPEIQVPVSSVINPRGTILYGSNATDPEKRVQLEIFYTCLSSDEDCQ
ncbi:DUF4270 domain-containing protein [Winogradskyella maritima]|uniref:DUF4270 domain-containing protein n=1 Tax=Winogradskyella maritima TaxID=1517766 RepID=A0ABV8AH31_9FLAO|nr:DUF4270 domain-containing protein [Winogradskyella maritima]